jgi:hypothetical protein
MLEIRPSGTEEKPGDASSDAARPWQQVDTTAEEDPCRCSAAERRGMAVAESAGGAPEQRLRRAYAAATTRSGLSAAWVSKQATMLRSAPAAKRAARAAGEETDA